MSDFGAVMDSVEMVLEDHLEQVSPPYDDDVSEGAREEMRETATALRNALDTVRGLRDSKGTFELYVDAANDWRWRLVHDNGNIIADSAEGYASKQKAAQGIASVVTNAPGASVVDKTGGDDGE